MRLLFIGEKRSPTAIRLGVTWADGRLCAGNLHDALRAAGIDPAACEYGNAFLDDGTLNTWDLACAFTHVHHGGVVVALGQKAARVLANLTVPHHVMIHPAARGSIRKRERYQAHVALILGSIT